MNAPVKKRSTSESPVDAGDAPMADSPGHERIERAK